jgi:hypothetical protein
VATIRDIDKLRQLRRSKIPSSRQIVEETLNRLNYNLEDPRFVRKHFNKLLREVFQRTLHVLEEYEEEVDREVLKRAGFQINSQQYKLLREYFLSVSQSRKQRGGKDFELQFQTLLERAAIPFEAQPRKERVDLILPNHTLWGRDRARAVLLSLKRTLRERWRQVADELQTLRCPNTYLVTAEESLSENVVREIFQRNIYLVVWDKVKEDYGNHRVFGFSELMKRLSQIHLPQWGQAS